MATYKIVNGKIVKIEEPKITLAPTQNNYSPSPLKPKEIDIEQLKKDLNEGKIKITSSSKSSSSSSSSNNSSSNQTIGPIQQAPIDMEELQKNLASGKTKIQISDTERNRQIQQQSIRGGTFVTPSGQTISSNLSELELNKGKLNESTIEKKDYFERFGRTPLRDVLSKGRNFVGSFVKIGETGADQKEVDEQANIFISKAKDKYVKNIFSNITENQKLKQEFEEEQAKLKKEQDRQQEIIERNKYKQQAEQEAKEGKISGGLKLAGLKIIELGQKVGESKAKINLLPTDPTFVLSKVLGDAPKQFTSGFIQGVGETAKGAGDIVSAASKRETYEKIAEAGKGTAEYFINVGKTAEIKGVKIKPGDLFPVQLDVEAGDKTKKDIEAAKLLGLTAGTKAVTNFIKDPFVESGKLIGSGAAIGGATSISGKLMGLGKAGVKIAKGGKYIKYEELYETKPSNLLKGKYKKGTPKTTQTEFIKGANPKTLHHTTGNLTDTLLNTRTGRGKVANTIPQGSDISGAYGSTGKAVETYTRISGEAYNLKPRIPFVNMPTKTRPATLRLIGTTKPKRLTSVGKFTNIKQGKKVFAEANISKNTPLTTPATELKFKIENEAGLRPGTIFSTKGIKGTQDFTFVKGVFVETPRVRVMPSKPKINIGRPARPSLIKKPVAKPVRQVSLSSSINQARNPGTFYNPSSLLKSSSPSRVSSRVSFSPKPSSSVSNSSSKIISSSTSPSIRPSPSPRPSPSRNPFRSSSSTSGSSSSSFISSRSSFSSSTSTIKSSSKPLIYKPSLLYKPTKYNKIAPRKKYGLKNVIKFNSFGKAKDSKVRFI